MMNLNDRASAADAPFGLQPLSSGCPEWRDILREYPAAMQHYCQAVMRLITLDAATFNEGWTKAEQARKVCENFRERLFHHRHEHGCLTSRSA